jgi:hypothetical protein
MLKANVGLSRKISRDYNSTGYSVNLDGEIPFTPDDAESVLEKVKELFNVAQEALNREIDRDQSEAAIGRRDEESISRETTGNPPNHDRPVSAPSPAQSRQPTNHQPRPGSNDAATPKQAQFINSLAKRQKLSPTQLGTVIHEALGRHTTLQQLTKKEAGIVIDALNGEGIGNRNGGRG